MKLNKAILPQLFICLTFVLAAFPILTFGLRSVFTILWAIIGILCVVLRAGKNHLFSKKCFLFLVISILPFLWLCVSMIYTNNYNVGVKRIIQMLPLLIFPIIFYLNRGDFNKKEINKIGWIFSISVIILVFYQIVYSLFKLDFLLGNLTDKEIVSNLVSEENLTNLDIISNIKTRRFRTFILEITDTHFTYQGLWIVFSVFFITRETLLLIKSKYTKGYLLLIFPFILIIWLFLISSRMPILAMVVALFYTIFLNKNINLKSQLSLVFFTLLFLGLGYTLFTPLRVRVDEVFKSKFEFPTESNDSYNYTSVNIRNGIYSCAYYISKNNLVLGVGIGDSQAELNACYSDKIGAKIYTWRDYNTHNQYLYFLVATGLIGLFLFLAVLVLNWRVAIINNNQLYLYFITVVSIVALTENILSRADGVMFFAFFGGLFLFNIKELDDNY